MSKRLEGLPDSRILMHGPHAFVLLCLSLEDILGPLLTFCYCALLAQQDYNSLPSLSSLEPLELER